MTRSDQIYLSSFAVDPDLDPLFDYDDLFDIYHDADSDQIREVSDLDDPDEMDWDIA